MWGDHGAGAGVASCVSGLLNSIVDAQVYVQVCLLMNPYGGPGGMKVSVGAGTYCGLPWC